MELLKSDSIIITADVKILKVYSRPCQCFVPNVSKRQIPKTIAVTSPKHNFHHVMLFPVISNEISQNSARSKTIKRQVHVHIHVHRKIHLLVIPRDRVGGGTFNPTHARVYRADRYCGYVPRARSWVLELFG